MSRGSAAAVLTLAGVLATGSGARVIAGWQARRQERQRQDRYPWMEPARHRGAR
jgi:hypothetical protein